MSFSLLFTQAYAHQQANFTIPPPLTDRQLEYIYYRFYQELDRDTIAVLMGVNDYGQAHVDQLSGSDVIFGRDSGRFQTCHPTRFFTMVIQNSLMPKKTSLPRARTRLTVNGICPIHAEPVHCVHLRHSQKHDIYVKPIRMGVENGLSLIRAKAVHLGFHISLPTNHLQDLRFCL